MLTLIIRFDTPIKRRAYEKRVEKQEKFNMNELSDLMNVHNELEEQEAQQANFLINTTPINTSPSISFGQRVVRSCSLFFFFFLC